MKVRIQAYVSRHNKGCLPRIRGGLQLQSSRAPWGRVGRALAIGFGQGRLRGMMGVPTNYSIQIGMGGWSFGGELDWASLHSGPLHQLPSIGNPFGLFFRLSLTEEPLETFSFLAGCRRSLHSSGAPLPGKSPICFTLIPSSGTEHELGSHCCSVALNGPLVIWLKLICSALYVSEAGMAYSTEVLELWWESLIGLRMIYEYYHHKRPQVQGTRP